MPRKTLKSIGLTEETDAIAIVVSEERGEVSASIKGRIYRDMDDQALRAFLRRHLKAEPEVEPEEKETAESSEKSVTPSGVKEAHES